MRTWSTMAGARPEPLLCQGGAEQMAVSGVPEGRRNPHQSIYTCPKALLPRPIRAYQPSTDQHRYSSKPSATSAAPALPWTENPSPSSSRAMAGFKLPLDVSGRSRGGGRGTPRKLPSHGRVAWPGRHRRSGESCCRKQPCQQSPRSQLNTSITLLHTGICAGGAHGVRLHGAWGHGLQHAQERP